MDLTSIRSLVSLLSPLMPYMVTGVVFTMLAIAAYFLLIVRSSRKKQAAKKEEVPDGEEKTSAVAAMDRHDTSPLTLRKSFANAVKLLRNNVPGRSYLYQMPWYLMIGEAGSGKTAALHSANLNLPFGKPVNEGFEIREGCNWWFFDEGAVLDIEGDYVLYKDGKSSFEKGWDHLISLLKKYRPERPLDGVILAIPCGDLIGPETQAEKRLNAASEKSRILYQKLWELQKKTGIFFPVYILVTQCDKVRGFKSFANEIPPKHRDDLFGWSSHFTLETAYSPEWVDEAFARLFKNLYEGQIELLADGIQTRDADGFFLLPTELQAVVEPLRVYLNNLFRQSVYHESFFFRGIYFCGDSVQEEEERQAPALAGIPAEPPPGDDMPPLGPPGSPLMHEETEPDLVRPLPPLWMGTPKAAHKKPSFLAHLFEKKIFPEYALARPVAKKFFTLNRAVATAQVLLAVILLGGGFGLWNRFDHLHESKKTLSEALKGIDQDLTDLSYEENRWEGSENTFFYDSAVNLLEGMTHISVNRFSSVLIPSSWFDPINEDIKRAMTLAYNKIILKSMYFGLQQKTENLLTQREKPAPAGGGEAHKLAFEQFPEFIELRQTVEEFAKIEQHANVYNRLRSSQELSDLSDVVFYLFGIRLPSGFFANAYYYHKALKEVDYVSFHPEVYKERAVPKVKRLVERFHDRLFRSGKLDRQMQDLVLKIERLNGPQSKSWPPETALRELEDILDGIRFQESQLGGDEYAWFSRDKLSVGEAFDRVLLAVDKSKFLGTEAHLSFENMGDKIFQDLKKSIARQETPLTGRILAVEDSKPRMELSPGALAMKTSLENFLGQKFMRADRPYKTLVVQALPGSHMFWDKKTLEEPIALFREYQTFAQSELKGPESPLRKLMERIANARLEQGMLASVAQAQNYKPAPKGTGLLQLDGELGPEISNFKDAVKLLGRIIDIFNEMNFLDSSWALSELTANHAANLLKQTDRQLEEERFYEFKDGSFAWWTGTPRVSLAAFEVRDPRELEFYLGIQRERAKHLAADYAEPLVRFLMERSIILGSGKEALVAKWQNIILDLERYDAKKPGNTVAALEKFILFDMDKISPAERCNDVSAKDANDPDGDFFLRKLEALRQGISQRCKLLADDEVSREYAAVETYFNRNLAGKFPFAPVSADRVFVEAKPDQIREFFWLLDNYQKTGKPLLEKSQRFGISREDALDFVAKLEKAREFFSPFLEKGKEKIQPTYMLDVDFRVNRKVEQGANQIIDWNFEVGRQKLTYLEPRRPLRWNFGDPISLSMRWAKDAPNKPNPITTAGARIEDHTVHYQYSNQWSLLSLLRKQASDPEDFERLADPHPHTLKFSIGTAKDEKIIKEPTRITDGENNGGAENQARIFIRVTVMTPEKSEVKTMPEFPGKAPHLTEDLRS